jgi:hypothetical protein
LSEITSPYLPGKPVAEAAMLFGRREAADWIELQITNKARTLILSGQPLIGKTSFVKHVGVLQNPNTRNLFVALPEPPTFSQTPDKQKKRPREKLRVQTAIDAVLQQVVEQLIPQLTQLDLATSQPIDAATPVDAATPATTVLYNLFTQAN